MTEFGKITDEQLRRWKVATQKAPTLRKFAMRTTVTSEHMQKRIKDVAYSVLSGTTVTVCLLTMVNGFTVMGKSACVNPRNFDAAVGRKFAYEDAVEQLWPLEGYLLAEELFHEARGDTNEQAQEQDRSRRLLLDEVMGKLGVPDYSLIPKTVDALIKTLNDVRAALDSRCRL